MNLNNVILQENFFILMIQKLYAIIKKMVKGGVAPMGEKEMEKELNEMLNRIEKQDETIRKLKGQKQYKDLSKGKEVIVYTNDKNAMKFWEE